MRHPTNFSGCYFMAQSHLLNFLPHITCSSRDILPCWNTSLVWLFIQYDALLASFRSSRPYEKKSTCNLATGPKLRFHHRFSSGLVPFDTIRIGQPWSGLTFYRVQVGKSCISYAGHVASNQWATSLIFQYIQPRRAQRSKQLKKNGKVTNKNNEQ